MTVTTTNTPALAVMVFTTKNSTYVAKWLTGSPDAELECIKGSLETEGPMLVQAEDLRDLVHIGDSPRLMTERGPVYITEVTSKVVVR